MGIAAEKVYFDANILIYLVDGYPGFTSALAGIRNRLLTGAWIAHTGAISICEVLVKPIRDGNAEAIKGTRHFLLESGAFKLVETTLGVYERAAAIRAVLNLKLPDAVHAACAVEANCTTFVSNDRSIRLPPDLTFLPFESISVQAP
jgi:predicted nucleic acid-binding protein